MAVNVEQTPNPNARKFSVGEPVGGSGTVVKGDEPDQEFLARLLEIDGVTSVFFTADFVTISKSTTGQWDTIVPQATTVLEAYFPD